MTSNNPPMVTLDIDNVFQLTYLRETICAQYVDNQAHLQTGFRYHLHSAQRATLTMKLLAECDAAAQVWRKLFNTDIKDDLSDDVRRAIAFLEGSKGRWDLY